MMLLQAGQLGLTRSDSVGAYGPPPGVAPGATVWLDFTDTSALFASGHLDGANVTTSGASVLSVNNKARPGYGVSSVGSSAGEYRTSATPGGKGAVAFNNRSSRYVYYDMRAPGYVDVALSTLMTTTSKVVTAAVKVAGSTPFNGLNMSAGDIIFGDSSYFALFVTEDAGVIYARASNRVSFPNNSIEQAIGRNTWVVLTASHQSGSLRIRVNGGEWVTVASGTTETLSRSGQILSNPGGEAGSEIAIAHIFTANTDQTDSAISAVEHWIASDIGITPWW